MTLRILIRRSKSEGQENSLDVQRAGCAALALGRGIAGPAVEYVGDGVAGDDIEGMRALRRLVDEAERGDTIVCRDHSRLGRDMLESSVTIRTLIQDNGARLFYYATGEEVRWRGAGDGFMTVARGFAAEIELEAIRSRTKEAIRSRVNAGWIGGGDCYGYTRQRISDGLKEHTIAVVNLEHAAVILRIVREYLDGRGCKAIAIGLNDDGVPSPQAKRRGSGSWSPGQVRDILKRERYRGVYVHGVIERKRKNQKRLAIKADPGTVIRREMPEWRIIDDVTWHRIQATFRERAPTLNSKSRQVHALSGLARCAQCGGSIGVVYHAGARDWDSRAYGCIRNRQRGPSVCTMSSRRPVAAVEHAIATAIRELCARPDVVEDLMATARAELAAETATCATVDTGALRAELAEVKREHRNLVRLAATLDEDDADTLREIRTRRDRAAQLERTIAAADRAPDESASMLVEMESALREAISVLPGFLDANPTDKKERYRGLFPRGLSVSPHPTAKPARWIITGDLDPVKALVTPTSHGGFYRGMPFRLVA